MKIATWNVNSVRARAERIGAFLDREQPDALAMQELKCTAQQFPFEVFTSRGYEVSLSAQARWNGVAIATRGPAQLLHTQLPDQPQWKGAVEARAVGVEYHSVELWSLYVPHGRGLDDPHMAYKLRWLGALRTYAQQVARDASAQMLLMGDFNVAPLDTDVWDIAAFVDSTHVSAPERKAFTALEQIPAREVTRDLVDGYTYWDYQKLRFAKDEGMRIDFMWATLPLAHRASGARIDRDERKGKGPSDHVPVIVTFS